jgi:hypothetical protein
VCKEKYFRKWPYFVFFVHGGATRLHTVNLEVMGLLNDTFFSLMKSRYLDLGSLLTHCLIRQDTGNTANDLWPRA